jgi:hypothetical protein
MDKSLIEKNLKNNFRDFSESSTDLPVFFYKGSQYQFSKKFLELISFFFKQRLKRLNITTEKFIIAGGSVLTMIMTGNPFLINDIDIFPCSPEDFNSLKDKFSSIECLDKIESVNSIKFKYKNLKIDLIKKYPKTIKDCIGDFDLSIVRCGFDQDFNFYHEVFWQDVFNFKMKAKAPTEKEAFKLLTRIIKYSKKGFSISTFYIADLISLIKLGENSETKTKQEYSKDLLDSCFNYSFNLPEDV